MELVVTKEWALKAVLMGACRIPEVGKKISSFSTGELIWAEDKGIAKPSELKKISLPVWVLSGNGDGYGYGNGYGDGYGNGDGNGDGNGYGNGNGNGYGNGDGNGYGNGDGYGYGDGYGNGYGNGDGNGDGYGYGNGDGNGYGINAAFRELLGEE